MHTHFSTHSIPNEFRSPLLLLQLLVLIINLHFEFTINFSLDAFYRSPSIFIRLTHLIYECQKRDSNKQKHIITTTPSNMQRADVVNFKRGSGLTLFGLVFLNHYHIAMAFRGRFHSVSFLRRRMCLTII